MLIVTYFAIFNLVITLVVAIMGEIGAIALVVGQILGFWLLISMNGDCGLQFSHFLF